MTLDSQLETLVVSYFCNHFIGFEINGYSTSLKLTTTQPATITTASLTQSTLDASAFGDVTFSIRLTHAVPANGMLVLIYPPQVDVAAGTLAASLISPSSIPTLAVSLTTSERKIQITNMFPTGAAAGSTYQFTVRNIKNSAQAAATNSFEITTFTSSTGAFRIDTVRTGLTLRANCDYPCASCSASTPSTCTSCLAATPALYLQNNACVTTCNEGKLPLSGTCVDCNSQCVTCAVSQDRCTKCGKTNFEFLSGTTCVNSCPDGTFGNIVTNTCDA